VTTLITAAKETSERVTFLVETTNGEAYRRCVGD